MNLDARSTAVNLAPAGAPLTLAKLPFPLVVGMSEDRGGDNKTELLLCRYVGR